MFTEFRGQLDTLLSLLVAVPPLVMGEVKGRHMAAWEEEKGRQEASYRQSMAGLAQEKVSPISS